ncbi:hypothetical protein GUJ93_ZPchr0012g18941 [Zizania palustris]|uniref:Uncharacterized protein n=1 Tax=Zizania palustris TaxID=103762 RepID=A0A8J6BPR0_ZIZPA|nr:hypothetical protein GUJ93_ZPchr0012g18941 [Zizania palustris]
MVLKRHEDVAIATAGVHLNSQDQQALLPLLLQHITQVLQFQVQWFPLDEDELPPNGGNPHPFNGDVFPGEPEWVQQWVDEQMIQGAFPAEADPEVEPQVVNIIEPVVEEGAWDDWPAQLPPAPQEAPPQ